MDVRLQAKKPVSKAYPKALLTLGDHLRKRRIELGLLQCDVAAQLHVDATSVTGWELGDHEPLVRQFPKIVKFLGYVPDNLFSSDTIGERIIKYRLLHGITRREFAR